MFSRTAAGRGSRGVATYGPKLPGLVNGGQIREMSMITSRRLMTLNGGKGFFWGERQAKSVRDVLNWPSSMSAHPVIGPAHGELGAFCEKRLRHCRFVVSHGETGRVFRRGVRVIRVSNVLSPRTTRLAPAVLACLVLLVNFPAPFYAQSTSANSGTVRGSVLDPSGAAIPNATVEIQNPVSRYDKTVQTDAQGNFEFDNVPYNNYHLSASASGFQGSEQDVSVRSPLPVELKIAVKIGAANESVTVTKEGIWSKPTPPPIRTWIGSFLTSCPSKAPRRRSVLW